MFKKYPEIENSYQKKFVDRFFEKYPGLSVEHFIVTEKLDGANFSVVFHSNGDMRYYTRNGRLADDGFYDWKSAFQDQDIQNFLEAMKAYSIRTKKTLQFVGELFGRGIQNRVYYGEEKYWRWFGIIDHTGESRVLSFHEEEDLIHDCVFSKPFINLLNLYVPTLCFDIDITKFSNIKEMIGSILIRRNSLFPSILQMSFREPNLMEGVVIRPKGKDYYSAVGDIFILKYKNEEFLEDGKIKVKKENKVYSPELNNLLTIGLGFINVNRSLSLFSKEGEIDRSSQIGEYIRLYAEDFFKDFMKEYDEAYSALEKKEQKDFNKVINKQIVKELKRFL